MENNLIADFCIAIDFEKGSEAPSRVFRALSDIIDSFHALDKDLIQSIDSKIEPIVLLEDIESGSIKTWLRYIFNELDDEALKKLDWKSIIGRYLVKAKYLIIKFLEDKTEITNRFQIEELNKNLLNLAQETNIKHIPAYTPLTTQALLQHLERMTKAVSYLTDKDKVKYITREDEASFNLHFKIVPELIEDILTKEKIESCITMILKVKKPDYLGESKWEFKHENKTIPMKILDSDWLKAFQNREIDIRPGDSIRAEVQIITKYGYDLNVVSITYNISKVLEVIPLTIHDQSPLF
jgi:hypothetical protein